MIIYVDSSLQAYTMHIVAIIDICNAIFTGLSPKLKVVEPSKQRRSVVLLGIRCLTAEGGFDPAALEDFPISRSLPASARPLREGDVLLSIRGSLPKCTLLEQSFSNETFA